MKKNVVIKVKTVGDLDLYPVVCIVTMSNIFESSRISCWYLYLYLYYSTTSISTDSWQLIKLVTRLSVVISSISSNQ